MFKMITSGTDFIKPEVGLIAASYILYCPKRLSRRHTNMFATHPGLGIVG